MNRKKLYLITPLIHLGFLDFRMGLRCGLKIITWENVIIVFYKRSSPNLTDFKNLLLNQ